VRAELDAYGNGLEDKPEIVALSQSDSMSPEQIKKQLAKFKKACKQTLVLLSAASGQGVTDVLRELFKIISASSGGTAVRTKRICPTEKVAIRNFPIASLSAKKRCWSASKRCQRSGGRGLRSAGSAGSSLRETVYTPHDGLAKGLFTAPRRRFLRLSSMPWPPAPAGK